MGAGQATEPVESVAIQRHTLIADGTATEKVSAEKITDMVSD